MTKQQPRDLLSIFQETEDPRVERAGLHKLDDILVNSICALLCGAESFGEAKEEWLTRFLELPHGIPSHDTFGRVSSG